MNERQKRKICEKYYLDCKSIAQIAKETGVSRREIIEAVDDPSVQKEYLDRARAARERAKVRTACAADVALERQVDFVSSDGVDPRLVPAQQRAAQAVLNRALQDEDSGEIRLIFPEGITLGMPAPMPVEEHGENDS